jgi:G:T-mismatch repair DNA endonuclease (very short patch repair protein)
MNTIDRSEKQREARARYALKRQGLRLCKNPARTSERPDFGLFCIIDDHKCAVAGTQPWNYSMSLDEVEQFRTGD